MTLQTRIEETWGLAGLPAYWGEVQVQGEWVKVTPYYAADEHGAGAKNRAEAALARFIERHFDEETE